MAAARRVVRLRGLGGAQLVASGDELVQLLDAPHFEQLEPRYMHFASPVFPDLFIHVPPPPQGNNKELCDYKK